MRHGDWGEVKPSDLDDEAPVPEVIIDQTGSINSSTNPVGRTGLSTCCTVADQALKMAQRALEQAERALRALQNVANQQEQPLGKCGGPCSATLTIDVRRCTLVKKVSGQISNQQGQTGMMIGSITVGSEKRCYNSAIAAQQAAQQLIADRNARNAAYNFTVGRIYRFGPSSVSPDLGLIPGTGTPCPEPAANDRAQIGVEYNPAFPPGDYGD